MKKISINIITNREGGLDAQLHYFGNQTVKDFEIVIIDELWDVRHGGIEHLIRNLGLDVVYLKPRRHMDNVVNSTHAMARNEALTYTDAKHVLFFDDYQIPMDNLLEEHLKLLNPQTAVVGQQIMLNYNDLYNPDFEDVKTQDQRYTDDTIKEIPYSWYWTNNASAPFEAMLKMNGIDERFNGGTGGEDHSGVGLPLTKLDIRILYNPNAICYHVDHDTIPHTKHSITRTYLNQNITPEKQYIFKFENHDHNLAAFVRNPYHDGDPDLMENEQFTCWRDKWGLKHYRCKYCGIEGICDSMELQDIKVQEDTYIAPLELFDLRTARDGFKAEGSDKGLDKYVQS